jgi:hypothetical protein
VGEVLYLVNDMQSIVTAIEAKTGASLFQGRLGRARREGFTASPVAVNGKVFFTSDEGETFVLEAVVESSSCYTSTSSARRPTRHPPWWTVSGTSGPPRRL